MKTETTDQYIHFHGTHFNCELDGFKELMTQCYKFLMWRLYYFLPRTNVRVGLNVHHSHYMARLLRGPVSNAV